MRKRHLVYAIALTVGMGACVASTKKQAEAKSDVWKSYNIGTVLFGDKVSETEGSDICHRITPDAESHIKEQARTVLVTLYNSPEDSIAPVNKIYYTLEDIERISVKGGSNGDVTIFYSTRYIKKSFTENDTAKLLSETRGVLLHELTHAYQSEPQGIGSCGVNCMSRASIEGMTDTVRVASGGFDGPNAHSKRGNYMSGYRTAGYFFVQLHDNRDPEFLRKFNRNTLEVISQSFDGAIEHTLGTGYSIDKLWYEYQVTVGDIQV